MSDDGNIDVRVTAQIDDLESGMNRSAAVTSTAARAMSHSFTELDAALQKTGGNMKAAVAALDAEKAALTAAGAAAQNAARSFQDIINATTGAGRAMSSAAESAKVFSAAIKDGSASAEIMQGGLKGVDAAAKSAAAGLHVGATGMREFIVIGHELAVGNFSRIPGSMMVLAERMNGLGTIVSYITPQLAIFGTIGAAAFAAVAYQVYQAYQGMRAIQETTTSLGMLGQGNQFNTAEITAWRDTLVTTFGESQASARRLMAEFDKLPAAASALRPRFYEAAEALAKLNHEASDKAAKELASAAEQTAEQFSKWAEKTYGLEGAIGKEGHTLTEQVKILVDAGRESEAYTLVMDAMNERFIKVGASAARATEEFRKWITTYGEAGYFAVGPEAPQLPKPEETVGSMGKRVPEEQIAGAIVAEKLVASENKRKTLNDQINTLKAAELSLTQQIAEAGASISVEAANTLQRQLERNRAAQANAAVDLAKVHSPAEQEAHNVAMARLHEQLALAKENSRERINIRQQIAEAEKKYAGEGSADAIKAEGQVSQAVKQAADQRLKDQVAELDARRAAVRGHADQEIAILHEKQKLLADNGKQETAEYRAIEREIEAARREGNQKAYQDFASAERLKIQEAKGSAAQIIAIYDEWISKAKGLYKQDAAEWERIQREKVRAVQQAYTEAYNQAMHSISGQTQIYRLEQLAFERSMKAMVDQKKISMQQAEGFDLQYYTKHYEMIRADLEKMLAADNITAEQRLALNIKLLELDEEYAAKKAQVAEKIAAANKAALEKEQAAYKTFFNSIGTEMENYLDAAVMRTKTFADATRALLQGVGKSVLKLLGDMASQYAAKQLAGSFGLEHQPGEGMGGLLSRGIGQWLGLEGSDKGKKDNPDVKENTTGTKANTDATNANTQAFNNAVGTLNTKMGGASGPGSGPAGRSTATAGAEMVNSEGVSDQAQQVINGALQRQGEMLTRYCAKLVNEALASAGLQGSGSDLASSFKNYGTHVDPKDVRAGDIFYSTSGVGQGYTGHVGVTMGGVENGQVQVMSSHTQSGSGEAGIEYRKAAGMEFRRPAYSDQQQVKVEPQSVAQGVKEGEEQSASTTTDAVAQGAEQGNQQLVDKDQELTDKVSQNDTDLKENTVKLDQSKQAIDKNTQKLGEAGSGGGKGKEAGAGAGGGGEGALGAATGLLGTAGRFVPGLGQLASAISGIQSAVKQIRALGDAASSAGSAASSMGSAAQSASSATQMAGTAMTGASTASTTAAAANTAQGAAATGSATANIANTTATGTNTVATEINSTAQEAGGGGGGGGIFGTLFSAVGMLFSRGGIVPSAEGGFLNDGKGGQLSILHPKEMVLPAKISTGIQEAISNGSMGGGNGMNNSNNSGSFTYAPQIQGGQPFATRSQMESMLRNHGSEMINYARNAFRNGVKL